MTEATTSLDLSVKLKEAGAPQESSNAPSYSLHYRGRGRYHVCSDLEHNEWCAGPYERGPRAFTVGEMLAEMLQLVHSVEVSDEKCEPNGRSVTVRFSLGVPEEGYDWDYDETWSGEQPDLLTIVVGDAYYWALKHKAANTASA